MMDYIFDGRGVFGHAVTKEILIIEKIKLWKATIFIHTIQVQKKGRTKKTL